MRCQFSICSKVSLERVVKGGPLGIVHFVVVDRDEVDHLVLGQIRCGVVEHEVAVLYAAAT